MIDIRGVTIRYPNRSIAIPRDLSVPAAGCFLIAGDNGCGKSSLVRAVLRLHDDFGGKIEIDGKDNRSMSRTGIARKVSYLPQVTPVEPSVVISEFVLQGLYAQEGITDASALLKETAAGLGIDKFLQRDYLELSGGERQLCRIARALIAPCAYSFLDEGDAFLSRKNRARFYDYIERISDDRAVVLVTHAPADVPKRFETLLEIYEG
ncbi:MAG: hypothetical protein A2Y33_07670 [Spirochaetes bacterium GWF1_51_8]|nr:MAG: hypothetical protein A2Y33_07670 [Spirochaetes bacterium GWF1_51_8]